MRLLNSRILMFTFRRSAWIRWFPPMESASPSPVMTQTDRSGRGAPMDRVHAVAVHVVRQPRRAADPGDDHQVLARDLQFRQEALEGGQDGVVAAARAPANFLVRLEVLSRELLVGLG